MHRLIIILMLALTAGYAEGRENTSVCTENCQDNAAGSADEKAGAAEKDRASRLKKIAENHMTVKPGELINHTIIKTNVNYDLKPSIRQTFRCSDLQYHIHQPVAVATLKLITFGEPTGTFVPEFYKNPSGTTWSAVFTGRDGEQYLVLNFRSKSDDEYLAMHERYPEYVNFSHHYAIKAGSVMTGEQIRQRIAGLEKITDLSGYSLQMHHMMVTTSDNQLLSPRGENGGFVREKLRFTEKFNRNSPVINERNAYLTAVKDFSFNTNATALLTDRLSGRLVISDDRDGLFHYLDEKGQELDSHLTLCYEVD